ncbi:DUF4013 domain-containing protein [Atopobiaceae bacterium 24-176]
MADTEFVNGRYLSRSWAMLTQDKGWWKPVLVLALCMFVPIAGPIAVLGYMFAWARLTAWGVDAAPKQTRVDVGGCFKTGWTAFVVYLGWGILLAAIVYVLQAAFSAMGAGIGSFMGFVLSVGELICGLFIMVAALRAVIYGKIGPGFGFSKVWTMVSHDFSGLLHVLGIKLLGSLVQVVIGVVLGICLFASAIPLVFQLVSMAAWGGLDSAYLDSAALYWLLDAVGSVLAAWIPLIVLISYLLIFVELVFSMLAITACALWIRQFNVPAWGGPGDPVPVVGDPVPPASPVNPVPVGAPAPQSGYQAPNNKSKEALPMDYKASENVTVPTNEDVWAAAEAVADKAGRLDPDPNAVDHMEYTDDPTHRPATSSDNGVTPPTPADTYGAAATAVADSPECAYPDSEVAAAEELLADKEASEEVVTPLIEHDDEDNQR